MERALPAGKINAFGAWRPVKIDGPATLYRFSGVARRKDDVAGAGEWWIGESVFVSIYQEARRSASGDLGSTVSSEFVRLYRERLAISLDWNDLQHFFRMTIPDGGFVTGLVGSTAPQPKVSFAAQHKAGRAIGGQYSGGADQILLRYSPAEWQSRGSWIKSVSF